MHVARVHTKTLIARGQKGYKPKYRHSSEARKTISKAQRLRWKKWRKKTRNSSVEPVAAESPTANAAEVILLAAQVIRAVSVGLNLGRLK